MNPLWRNGSGTCTLVDVENEECEPSVWDLTDPADLLRRMGSRLRFRPGEIRAATVVDASTTCRLLGQERVVTDSRPWSTYGDWDALDRLGDRLGEAVERLPLTGNAPGKPPWTTLVVVSARYGRVVRGPVEACLAEADHFCNEIPIRGILRGSHILLTEHGWVSSTPPLAGAEPRLAPPRAGRARPARARRPSGKGSAPVDESIDVTMQA